MGAGAAAPKAKIKILMAAYGGGHVNLMIPVYRRLATEFDVTFLGLSIAGRVLSENRIAHTSYASYRDVIVDDDARRYGRELADRWHVDGKVPRVESEAYLGACMRDLVRDLGPDEAYRRLEELGRKAFLPLHTARQILARERPQVIVTTNSPRTERALTLAGNQMGITTVNIHDHLGFEKRHTLTADYVAVMCDITRDNLMRTGHDPDRIFITGQPAFDAILDELATFDRSDLCRRHGLDPAGRYLLFAGQKHFTEAMLRGVFEAVAPVEGHRLLVKPHPGEDYRLYRSLLQGYAEVQLITDVNIRELIFLSEAVIALWSTVALEAVLMGKPLVQLNYPELPNIVPLFQYGVALEAGSPAAVGRLLEGALGNEGVRGELLQQRRRVFGGLLTGRSTDNLCALIRRAAADGKRAVP